MFFCLTNNNNNKQTSYEKSIIYPVPGFSDHRIFVV